MTLTGNAGISSTDAFLQQFANLRSLDLRDFAFDQVPNALESRSRLDNLTLDDCGLVWTAESQAVLSSLSNLSKLELIDNPLGVAPDISALPRLTFLDLSNSGITTLDSGLLAPPDLSTAIFHGNLITELPEALFQLPASRSEGFQFGENPLSAASRERIKSHFQTYRRDFGVRVEQRDIDLARKLFPTLDWEIASDVVYDLPGTLDEGRIQLQHWETEITRLTQDLSDWTDAVPTQHPMTGAMLSAPEITAERLARQEFAKTLEQLWRQRHPENPALRAETLISTPVALGELPALSADFKHISELSLVGHEGLNVPDGFLQCFNGLSNLELRGFNLGRFPQALSQMSALETLALSSCHVVFDAEAQATLSSMSALKMLDLYNNALGGVPDVSSLSRLTFLDLSRTAIDRVPAGLTQSPQLEFALLNENAIGELPDDLSGYGGAGVDLSYNPLSAASRDRIKAYFEVTEDDLGVPADQPDVDVAQALYPHLSAADASGFIYHLPGTLAQARLELLRRQTELATLINDLDAWVSEAPVDPPTQPPLDAQALLLEQTNRRLFRDSLERCWRQYSSDALPGAFTCDLAFVGEPPLLAADFSHVRRLKLTSEAQTPPAVDRILQLFTHLQRLEVQRYPLGHLPVAALEMRTLEDLRLPDCGIVLNPQAREALGAMDALRILDLRHNPLGLTPDLSNLKNCSSVYLSHTGLSETPKGLFDIPRLIHADLSNNAITQLPVELAGANPNTVAHFDFSDNPLSAESQQHLAAYNAAREIRLTQQQRERQAWHHALDDASTDDSDLTVGSSE